MAIEVKLSQTDIETILTKIVIDSTDKFKCYEISFMNKDKVVGFWGDHLILKIFTDSNIYDFFLKAIPKHVEKRSEFIQETGFFEKEIKIYENLLPKLNLLSSISWTPKCFLTKQNHFIVLEHLKNLKVFHSEQNIFDYDHCIIAVKSLAVLHASSLIYEQKFGKFSAEDLKLLEEVAYPKMKNDNHVRKKGLESGIVILTKLINLVPKYKDSQNLNEILSKFPDVIRKIYQFVEPSQKYKNVFSHSDLWINNIMFKYDKHDKPQSCKFIDFQFSRYSPPASDVSTLVYTSTTCQFRKLHLIKVLDIYYEQFESELILNNINPMKEFPRDQFLKSFNEYRLSGLIEAALFCHQTLIPSNLSIDMMNSSVDYEKFFTHCRADQCLKAFENVNYRDRMTEILSEIIDEFILA